MSRPLPDLNAAEAARGSGGLAQRKLLLGLIASVIFAISIAVALPENGIE
jgi:hypothetical protein